MLVNLYYGMDDNDCAIQAMSVQKDDLTILKELQVNALCECPEDATIERDLVSCNDILEYMKLAYEAGKNGEPFTVSRGSIEEPDYLD